VNSASQRGQLKECTCVDVFCNQIYIICKLWKHSGLHLTFPSTESNKGMGTAPLYHRQQDVIDGVCGTLVSCFARE